MDKIKFTKKDKSTLLVISILLALLTLASWILNFGYTRLTLSFVLFPVLHCAAAILINIFSAKYASFLKNLKVYTWLYNVSYALFYLLLPDQADVGRYMVFGLIENNVITGVATYFAWAFFIISVVIFVLQIVEIEIQKRRLK